MQAEPLPEPQFPSPTPAPRSSLRILCRIRFPTELLSELEAVLGVSLALRSVPTGEALLEQARKEPWDLYTLTDREVWRWRKLALLRPLPRSFRAHPPPVNSLFVQHYFDPYNRFAWPFGWCPLGIAYRPDKVSPPLEHWKDLRRFGLQFRPPQDAILAQALYRALYGRPKETLETTVRQWQKKAAEVDLPIAVDEISLLELGLSPQAAWKLLVPKEGSWISLYHWAVASNSPAPETAASFVQAASEPKRAARLASENRLAVVSEEARKYVPLTLAQDPHLYPPPTILDRCVFARPDLMG